MNRLRIPLLLIIGLSLIIVPYVSGCQTEDTSKLKVVATTSLITQIVERVGGDMVEVTNIIPPAQCPGHFDVTVSDVQKLADATLFILHGWQGEMFSEELIASAGNTDLTVVRLDIQENWMTPSVQQAAVDEITVVLSDADSKNSDAYKDLADEYKSSIMAKQAEIQAELGGMNLASINVMCSEQLIDFIQWLGLNVVQTYGRPDSFTPQVVQELVDTGREENVVLIIENLQSGQDAAAGVAEELGCTRIVITNFPGGFDNTDTWEKAIDYDVNLILGAIAQ